MRESVIEKYLVNRVKERGGEVRKVRFLDRNGAPDRFVMLPYNFHIDGCMVDGPDVWVEVKRPGEKTEPHQEREHRRMRYMGQRVVVIDSIEGVEALIK
jgi:hypothetical protein